MGERMNEETASVIADAQAIHTTINSNGWKNVIHPTLENRAKALLGEFQGASTYEEFVRIQQAMNAINGLLSYIEVKLIEGKTALEEMKLRGNRDDKSRKELL